MGPEEGKTEGDPGGVMISSTGGTKDGIKEGKVETLVANDGWTERDGSLEGFTESEGVTEGNIETLGVLLRLPRSVGA